MYDCCHAALENMAFFFAMEVSLFLVAKVGVLRDSHYLFSTPYRKFE
jgi:hypothetical protein